MKPAGGPALTRTAWGSGREAGSWDPGSIWSHLFFYPVTLEPGASEGKGRGMKPLRVVAAFYLGLGRWVWETRQGGHPAFLG